MSLPEAALKSGVLQLVVLVHGLDSPLGGHRDMRLLESRVLVHPGFRDFKVFVSTVNSGKTTDSIHVAGIRLADELERFVHALPEAIKTVRLSILAHSLGGLLSRYAIGWLYERNYFQSGRMVPVAYMSMASPHIGISYDRDNCETREEDNRRIFTNVARWVFYESKQRVAKLFWRGQCVTELYLQDEGAAGSGSFKPLLYELAVPTSRYMLALGLFKSRTLVSNTHFDFQVDYLSSAIACDYPFDTPGDVVGMDLGETCQRPSDSYEGLKHPSIGLVAKTVGLVKQVADIARFPFDWFNYSADEDHDIFSVTYTGFSSVPKSLCNISARAYSEPQEKKITTPAISRSIGRLRAEITRNLQTLSWRRIDTRFNSLWCHDYFLGKSTVHFSVVSDPKPARPVLDMFLNVLAEDANQA